MASPVIADLIVDTLKTYQDVRTYSLGQTAANAVTINEAPGLMFDPSTGGSTITSTSMQWKIFWESLFEVTTQTLILMYQQSLDLNRAKALVAKLRTRNQYQDGPVFNLNQIA
jgi:hypothetical protein